MKEFLGIFVMSFIICYIFLFFFGALILENIWAMLVFVAIIIAILTKAFISQETKIEELETRIKTLESKYEPKE